MPKAKEITKVKREQDEEFRSEDCDARDLVDDAARKRKKKSSNDEETGRKQIISTNFLPSSTRKLRACVHCKLVLNRQRWVDLGRCPNCPHSGGLSDTTEDFQNVIGQIYPKMSWVAQYQGISHLIPGIYAMTANVDTTTAEDGGEEDDDY